MKENTLATNFEPHECIIFVQSTKIGTHENKAIHSTIQNIEITYSCHLNQCNNFLIFMSEGPLCHTLVQL